MGGPLGAIIGRHPAAAGGGGGDELGGVGGGGGDGIIRHNRRCRDLAFLVLFAAFWVAMIVNSSFGFNQGNPLRLTYELDYKGNICGSRHGDPDLHELDIAITGKGFFKASVLATGLIMNNILRIGKVNVIGDVILFLGKLCVSLFCALFAFLMLDTHKYKSAHNKISSPLVPVVVSWALGFIVAKLFFQVVEMSIDTIILSFCQDAEEHQGNAQYAPPLLMETLDEQSELQRLTQGP
uniref:Choline transporter-like protein n=1 Tax=Oryza glumipatula TaxID=40148 RepID=A0A0D9ZSK6_9ORYZ